jgi:O-antigen/teichoic acid export membrane protein
MMFNPITSEGRALVARLRGSGPLASIAKLAAGSTIAVVISMALTPVITRLYHPEEYGVAASYAAFVAILGPVAALRYDFAIVLSEHDDEAGRMLRFCFTLAACTSLVIAIAVATLSFFSAFPLGRTLGPLILLLPLSVFAFSATEILGNWANRTRQYDLLARVQAIASALSPTISIAAFLVFGAQVFGLIAAALVALAGGAIYLALTMWRRHTLAIGAMGAMGESPLGFKALAFRHRQFPMFNLWMTLLDGLTQSLPVLVFAVYFSPSTAAYFALASSLMRLPATIVGGATSQVFYERAARQRNSPVELKRLLGRNVLWLTALILAPMAIVALFGPSLFGLVFGSKWQSAGDLARFLTISAGFTFVASPVSRLPSVLGQQHKHLGISLLAYAGRFGGLLVGVSAGSPSLAVVLCGLAEAASIVLLMAWLWRYLSRSGSAQGSIQRDS